MALGADQGGYRAKADGGFEIVFRVDALRQAANAANHYYPFYRLILSEQSISPTCYSIVAGSFQVGPGTNGEIPIGFDTNSDSIVFEFLQIDAGVGGNYRIDLGDVVAQ